MTALSKMTSTAKNSAGWHPVTFALVLLAAGIFASCGGGDSVDIAASPPPPIAVTVAPATASIATNQTRQFTAAVANSSNPAVTWKVNGVPGGNANTVGVISPGGLYTPPLTQGTRSITATSVADPSKSGSATVTVTLLPPPIAVTVTPAAASITTIQTQQFTATVANSSDPAVIWNVNGVPGGNANTVGVISPGGLYTPPLTQGTRSITATSVADSSKSGAASVAVKFLGGVLTYHNDNARTGQYLQETVLTPANVKSATFGKLFSFPVDGFVYAQPLYVSAVPVAGQVRNVVFVATEHNSVYAFDADSSSSTPLWHRSFIGTANGITTTTVPFQDTASVPGGPGPVIPGGCTDLTPEIGITGTPVIDPATGTLYVVAKTKEVSGANVAYEHRLHALDIRTGSIRPGSGRALHASVPGTSTPNDGNGNVLFQSLRQNQRAALLLTNNVISVAFSSHCVIRPYQGWVLAYDATTLNPLGAFNAVPDDPKGKGGIWHSGGGPAADANGNVFVMTGDGPFNVNTGGSSFADSVIKLTNGSLTVTDYFTPFNYQELEAANADMSAGGPLLLPDQSVGPAHLMLSLGKQGIAYLLNRDNLGQVQAGDSQIVQFFNWGTCGTGRCTVFGTPAYFESTVYLAAVEDKLRAYTLSNGQFSLSGQSTNTFQWPGATPAISANGSSNGIVWVLETNGSGAPVVLRAYSAADVSTQLYNSDQNLARDNPGQAVKFTVPMIANGKVYVGAQRQVSVFGLLP